TDAGREGELIFRYIYEASRCKKAVRRLWLSSLTDDAIARAFGDLKDGRAYDPLGRAARARSRADWLVGLDFSRAYSITHDDMFSVGRVQTPTLAMVVARELEIGAFVPEDYLEVAATFRPHGAAPHEGPDEYRGLLVAREADAKGRRETVRFAPDDAEAKRIVERVARGTAPIE